MADPLVDAARNRSLAHFVLSYEELAYLLGLLGVEPTVGVDDNPLRGLPPEQIRLALAVAGRGLRARGLVRDDAKGQPVVQSELLATIGTYGFPERIATVYHWAAGEELPAPCYGYVRAGRAVLHQRPGAGLHEFVTYGSPTELIAAMLYFCEAAATPAPANGALRLPLALLTEMRRLAGQPGANRLLAELSDQAQRPLAERFVQTLSAQPRVSAFTTLRSSGPENVDVHEFTFLQQNGGGWLLTPEEDEQQVMDVRAVDVKGVQARLAAALAD
jgi:hypothetical protein